MATAAAALTARARREIQHAFFSADAVRPDRAIGFRPDNGFAHRQFAELRKAGAIHEERPGLFWLDLPAYDRMLRRRLERVRIFFLVLIATGVLLSVVGTAIRLSN